MQEIERPCYDLINKDLRLKTKLSQYTTFYYKGEFTDASSCIIFYDIPILTLIIDYTVKLSRHFRLAMVLKQEDDGWSTPSL